MCALWYTWPMFLIHIKATAVFYLWILESFQVPPWTKDFSWFDRTQYCVWPCSFSSPILFVHWNIRSSELLSYAQHLSTKNCKILHFVKIFWSYLSRYWGLYLIKLICNFLWQSEVTLSSTGKFQSSLLGFYCYF